jgi:medium-chain acyl-[acyl-carrier-protein] hydrolase
VHHLADDLFLAEVARRYGEMPAVILQDVELMKLLIPVLRADITALETYVHKEEDPLDCPIYAFGGNSDSTTTAQDLEAWHLHTKRTFELKIFHGDHFFIRNNRQSVFTAILAKLNQVPQLASEP